jgi:hypothetical protein
MFMPVPDDKVTIGFGKLLRSRELSHFQTMGFPQFYRIADQKNCFAFAMSHVHVDRRMFVAVKENTKPSRSKIFGIFDETQQRLLLPLRAGLFDSENRLALFHQVEPIARNRFQVGRVRLQQIDFASLAREQDFLVVHLRLQAVDFSATLGELFISRQKQTHDHQPECDHQKHAQNAIETLPDGGFAPRAEIAVAGMIH